MQQIPHELRLSFFDLNCKHSILISPGTHSCCIFRILICTRTLYVSLTCAGTVNLLPPTIFACPDGENITLTCNISEQTTMTWMMTVPNIEPEQISLLQTGVVSSDTVSISGAIFFFERVSSHPFVVTLSLNASFSLNGTMISCGDGTNMETVTVSITGILLHVYVRCKCTVAAGVHD